MPGPRSTKGADAARAGRNAAHDLVAEAKRLLPKVMALRAAVLREGAAMLSRWEPQIARKDFNAGASNMAHYLALRGRDLGSLQTELSGLGLSSLGRSEGRVVASLDAVCATLAVLAGKDGPPSPTSEAHRAGRQALNREQRAIFGRDPKGPGTRIMVTLPALAAGDRMLVTELIRAGADCMRINCAHDGPEIWAAMIENCRAAAADLRQDCRVLMDIAGPKCRIAEVVTTKKPRVFTGDSFTLVGAMTTEPAINGFVVRVTFPEVIKQLKPGARVYVDDGKIGARVERLEAGRALLRVQSARAKGEKLKINKGLNFPDTALKLPPLTEKDLRDLDFVAEHADLVGCSFVQRPGDIALMQRELAARRGKRVPQPLVIKIETDLAVRNLPELIVQGAGRQPLAVMIARGDLAVELGFGRIGEVQENILWLCEAAHVPVVWATQVLAGLVEEGAPSRAEATDAAMGQRAECVMLNKGPYVVEAVRFLDELLHRMDRHQTKKSAKLGPLSAWSGDAIGA